MLNLRYIFYNMKNIIVASTSTIHNGTFLSYLLDEIEELFSETNEILFIPYARPSGLSYDEYTKIAAENYLLFLHQLKIVLGNGVKKRF